MFGNGGHEIVSMKEREKERALASLRIVESYWHALRSDDSIPLRSQIDPRGMEDALEYAFLAEKLGPSLAKIRVGGSHMNDLMGMEVSGMPLSALFTPRARDRLAEAIPQLFGTPAVIRIGLSGEAGIGRPKLEGALVLLPLRSDLDDVSRAIGCLATNGIIGRKPRRFEIDSVEVTSVTTARPQPDVPAPRPARGLAEAPAPFGAKPTKAPHLRIVISND